MLTLLLETAALPMRVLVVAGLAVAVPMLQAMHQEAKADNAADEFDGEVHAPADRTDRETGVQR